VPPTEAAPIAAPEVDTVATAAASSNAASRTAGTTSLPSADTTSSSLASQAQPILPAWTPASNVSAAAPGVADAAPVIADGTRSAAGGSSLVQSLGEHLQVQLARGSESAVIRLDPPSLGSIEIVVRHEAGSLQVHLNASNGEVLSQLQGIGEALRQDLMQRHQGSVSVQVSDDWNDAKERQAQTGGGREEPEQAPQANADREESAQFALA
jgi:flagellar hook-length control protein FliK